MTLLVFTKTTFVFGVIGSNLLTRYLLAPICSTWNRFGHLHFATWRVTCKQI